MTPGAVTHNEVAYSGWHPRDVYPKFRAAAVQAAPVFLNKNASIDKACVLVEEAASHGAKLIVLPEVFIPGGPYWASNMPMREGLKFSVELYNNSVEVPSSDTVKIGEVANRHQVYVVIGINERDGKTIYNTLLFFDREGAIIGKHRKFKPTAAEKLVWGEGDGSTHKVYSTEIGRIGGLICAEHTMALPGFSLAAMGEQVHVASWMGFAPVDSQSTDISFVEICSRYHAIAYNTFVICSQSLVDDSVFQVIGEIPVRRKEAWSNIIEAGTGKLMAEPPSPTEEGIVYGDIDLARLPPRYFHLDGSGQYWSKHFQLYFDNRALKPLNIVSDPENSSE